VVVPAVVVMVVVVAAVPEPVKPAGVRPVEAVAPPIVEAVVPSGADAVMSQGGVAMALCRVEAVPSVPATVPYGRSVAAVTTVAPVMLRRRRQRCERQQRRNGERSAHPTTAISRTAPAREEAEKPPPGTRLGTRLRPDPTTLGVKRPCGPRAGALIGSHG